MPEKLKHASRTLLALLAAVLLVSYFVSMALGPLLFYLTSEGIEVASERVAAVPLSLFMVLNFGIPLGISAGFFFMMLWVLYLCAFVLAWTERPAFGFSIRTDIHSRLDVLRFNYIVLMPCLASALLVVVVLLHTIQASVGVQTGSLEFQNPFIEYLSASYVALVEELSFRITTIGFFDGLFMLWKMRGGTHVSAQPGSTRVLLLCMWSPEKAKRLLGYNTIEDSGLKRGILGWEWLLLVATSASFGAVHYLSGGGWEIGKISTVFISGLALGFVYLRYGAYAPILLHWFFNYYFGTYYLAAELGVPGFDWIATGVMLVNLGAGVAVILILILTSLAGRLSRIALAKTADT